MSEPSKPSRGEAERRRRERLAQDFPALLDFDDPRFAWRRLFAELFGTFLLVLSAAGAGVVAELSGGGVSRSAVAAAPGLTTMVIILFMGAVSGAHLNPVVTLAFALRSNFSWRRVPGYVLAQLTGAGLACLFLLAAYGEVGDMGATLPGPGLSAWQALATEIVLTVGLVSTILGTASVSQNVGSFSAIAIGGYIVLAGLWAGPVSGASMNPARSFGPALVLFDFSSFWVYVVGPTVGAAIAVGFARILRGPAEDIADSNSAPSEGGTGTAS